MNTYYQVTLDYPCNNDSGKEIGCYISKDLAVEVWHFLHKVNDNHLGFKIKIQNYQGEFVYCPSSIRLKDTPNGKITTICDKLGRAEYLRLINFDISDKNYYDHDY